MCMCMDMYMCLWRPALRLSPHEFVALSHILCRTDEGAACAQTQALRLPRSWGRRDVERAVMHTWSHHDGVEHVGLVSAASAVSTVSAVSAVRAVSIHTYT